MNLIHLKEPNKNDEELFLLAIHRNKNFLEPWMKVPLTHDEFYQYIQKYSTEDHKSYWAYLREELIGVFNISGIVRGLFQSAYLGYYGFQEYTGKGLMSQSMKLLLKKVFLDLDLHRIEANIQPNNYASIQFIQRNGFRKEGFSPRYLKINSQWCDHERWAITKEDWKEMNEKY